MRIIWILLGLITCNFALPQDYPNVTKHGPQYKIVGGKQIRPNELRYQVSLRENNQFICGGSILSPNYILTAAHCVADGSPNSFSIVAGEHDMSKMEAADQFRLASKVTIHPNYNAKSVANDIAVLRLSYALRINDNVRPINLPIPGSTASGNATVSGWGRLAEKGQTVNTPRQVNVSIITDATCRKIYGNQIIASMICAGVTAGGKDACGGDSGGALAQGNTLVGIVSWGNGCARPNRPGVYTEVSHFITWIRNNTHF